MREVVLIRDGRDVKTGANCRITSRSWFSYYDGLTLTSASQVDIEHVVPLAHARRSGARNWSADRRRALASNRANERTELREMVATC